MSESTSAPGWFWYILLYLIGLGLFFLELFVPSGGIIALAAVMTVGYSIYSLWTSGYSTVGVITTVLTFLYLIWLIRWGIRKFSLASNLDSAQATGDDVRAAESMIGQTGKALTALRPSGMARLQGRRVDVVAQHGFIAKGAEIEVFEVNGNRIVVRESPPHGSN